MALMAWYFNGPTSAADWPSCWKPQPSARQPARHSAVMRWCMEARSGGRGKGRQHTHARVCLRLTSASSAHNGLRLRNSSEREASSERASMPWSVGSSLSGSTTTDDAPVARVFCGLGVCGVLVFVWPAARDRQPTRVDSRPPALRLDGRVLGARGAQAGADGSARG